MSDFFRKSQNTSITDSHFSHVEGDQYNCYNHSGFSTGLVAEGTPYMTTTVHVNGNQINQFLSHSRNNKRSEFTDFRNVKRGDIYRLEDIYVEEHNSYSLTVCLVKVNGTQGRFTAVTYSGPDAYQEFEDNFLACSRALSCEATQVYAVDAGTIPSLILWNDLMPVAHLTGKLGSLGRLYLYSLCRQWDCEEERLWIDPGRGMICRGPQGPCPDLPWWSLGIGRLPSTMDLLQEDVFLRFLANFKSRKVDRAFVRAICWDWPREVVPRGVDRPTIVSTLTNTPIAVADHVWDTDTDLLVEREVLRNGVTRFRLNDATADGEGYLLLRLNRDARNTWLSQASSIFCNLKSSSPIEDDCRALEIVVLSMRLESHLPSSHVEYRRRIQQPVYLFVHSPSYDLLDRDISSLHYWSLQRDGQTSLSPDLCRYFGLPAKLLSEDDCWSYFLPTEVYNLVYRYQLLRGFDPTTADFARYLEYYHSFRSATTCNGFGELCEEESSSPLELDCGIPSPWRTHLDAFPTLSNNDSAYANPSTYSLRSTATNTIQ
ncbi:hypothetical protein PM082_006358 [Marasmius tenuissimus]|nr:hypothetical protein PM082_006358 [Marasmius tenuissimus]